MTNTKNIVTLTCFVVISITVVGYFTGLQAPMQTSAVTPGLLPLAADNTKQLAADTITATRYADMHEATRHRTAAFRTTLTDLKSTTDPFAEFKISAEEKTAALQRRDANRALNVANADTAKNLQLARAALLTGAIARIQIRYRWQDTLWIDTLESKPDGYRIIRIAHVAKSEESSNQNAPFA